MRRTGPIRAALISLAGAGLGYVCVGRIRLAIVFAVLSISIMAAAGWTRLILHPLGTYIFAGCAILTVVVPILHSAFIAHRQRSIPRKTYNRWWIYLLWAAGSWLLIEAYLGLRADWFGFEPFRVPARSMVPTLDRGDYIMADTWHFDRADPEYGELVVFEAPDSAGVFYVKRLIGLPDDRVEIRDDVLYRNGRAIAEP
jgi:signal peptidase I